MGKHKIEKEGESEKVRKRGNRRESEGDFEGEQNVIGSVRSRI